MARVESVSRLLAQALSSHLVTTALQRQTGTDAEGFTGASCFSTKVCLSSSSGRKK